MKIKRRFLAVLLFPVFICGAARAQSNPAEGAQRFAKAISAPVVNLDSPCGHLSFTCISIGPIVAQFLADPASLHSQTLHEAPGH